MRVNYTKTVRPYFGVVFLFIVASCTFGKYGDDAAKLVFFNSNNKKTFSFVVSEKFTENHHKSNPSTLFPKMNVAELKLLTKFLRQNKYCIDKDGELSFVVNSKQDKVYDVTFASLIERSYNAKPVSPTTYFGECL